MEQASLMVGVKRQNWLAEVAARARSWLSPVIEYALPSRCHGCGVVIPADGDFCVECWPKVRFLSDPQCARCGVPFEHDQGAGAECGACLANEPPWDSARAAVAYGDIARGLAMRFKYGRRVGLAELMARQMLRQFPAQEGDKLIIVPVPLHRWRIWSRGFNQSALIARALGRMTGLSVDVDLLRRVKRTPPLRAMSRSQRAKTVRSAFAVRPGIGQGALAEQTIILIDDVHTTGATLSACTKVLRDGGAKAVHVLAWARVLPNSIDPLD